MMRSIRLALPSEFAHDDLFRFHLVWMAALVLLSTAPSSRADDSLTVGSPSQAGAKAPDRPQLAIAKCIECHGSNVAGSPVWQRASTTWYTSDPHAQAYTLLLNAHSQQIIASLEGEAIHVDSDRYRKVLNDKCVSCHSNELASNEQIKLGIDCQVCHGPATAWGDEHFSQATRDLGPKRFDGTGRINLESISERARMCSSCHIGELNRGPGRNDREVDHQIMAAGHPMTYFDFENYLERYPKHWNTDEENERLGAFPAYTRWRTGKLVGAEVRLKLLHDRAQRIASATEREGIPVHDWPEFTEYSCTSCHHQLIPDSWRLNARNARTYVWDEWYLEFVNLALQTDPSTRAADAALSADDWMDQLTRLRGGMEVHSPSPSSISDLTRSLMDGLHSEIDQSSVPSHPFLVAQMKRLLDDELAITSWEKGAQWATTARMLADSLGWERASHPLTTGPSGGFFGPPRVWGPIPVSPAYQASDWFHPETLSDYRDSLKQQLGSRQ